jgi:ABC-2 type transport system permease protein
MSAMPLAVHDSRTMLRRNIRRMVRYPAGPASTIAVPLVVLFVFVTVFGDTMGAGLMGAAGGRGDCLEYVVPGILLLSVAGAAQGVAISVAMDMTEGIINRFRTMAISRGAILAGHVVGNLLQTMAAIALIIVVTVILGFRASAGPLDWLAAAGLLAATSLAVIWLAVALGLVSGNVETASNLPMPLILLPFLGSGFVPTDSMPTVVGWFAEHQPFTPIMETLRGLLLGTAIGNDGLLAVVWILAIGLLGRLWAVRLFDREPTP